jgi:hypothetical protein
VMDFRDTQALVDYQIGDDVANVDEEICFMLLASAKAIGSGFSLFLKPA